MFARLSTKSIGVEGEHLQIGPEVSLHIHEVRFLPPIYVLSRARSSMLIQRILSRTGHDMIKSEMTPSGNEQTNEHMNRHEHEQKKKNNKKTKRNEQRNKNKKQNKTKAKKKT